MKIDHGIFSTFILLFSLIQEGLLSVTSESICTTLSLSLPRENVGRLTDSLNMTIAIVWDVKPPKKGAQLLIGRVLDLRPRGHEFKPHRHHCAVSLSKTHKS